MLKVNILRLLFILALFIKSGFAYDTIAMDPYGFIKDQDCKPMYIKSRVNDFSVEIDRYGIFRNKKSKKRLQDMGRFVMDWQGEIYYLSTVDQYELVQKERKSFFHSSFFNGGPVALAGYLFFDSQGKITKVNNESGHYRPAFERIKIFDEVVKKNGIKYRYERVDATVSTSDPFDHPEIFTSNQLKTSSSRQREQGNEMMIFGCKISLQPKRR